MKLTGRKTASNKTMNGEEEMRVGRSFPSVLEFYPEISRDLTQVTWAHGVNNRTSLDQALRSLYFLSHFNFHTVYKTTMYD